MEKVKRVDSLTRKSELIDLEIAVAEILFHNYAPDLMRDNENIVREQLTEGFILTTEKHHYYFINPVEDFIRNIDDDIEF